jgi:phosphonate transport system permease protein
MSVTFPISSELLEADRVRVDAPASVHRPHRDRRWNWFVGALVLWSVWASGIGRGEITNARGWPLLRRFFVAAVHPELSATFLRRVLDAALTTAAYAVLGTIASVALGGVLGILISETWWRDPMTGRKPGRMAIATYALLRAVNGLVRGVHEGVWALVFVIVLGLNPLVAVLAIALPYGAITATVYASLIDQTAGGAFRALRATGTPRLPALIYGVIPLTLGDLVSYAFYRLECSIRAGVILGMIGAGGLGFELSQSFQSLAYHEMWTLIAALIILSALANAWSSTLRRRSSGSTPRIRVRRSLVIAAALAALSWWHLHINVSTLWSRRTADQFAFLRDHSWPPRGPADGWLSLGRAAEQTVQIAVLALVIASTLGALTAMVAARRSRHPVARVVGSVMRGLLLLSRSIPSPVWALLMLFVLLPGIVPAAAALGMYTYGVLGRLMAEVVENADPRPSDALRRSGASSTSAFAYGVVPLVRSRFAALSLYRWEVATRETIVIGIVGSTGLGRILERQRVGLDYRAMVTTIAAMVVLTLIGDIISRRIQRRLR